MSNDISKEIVPSVTSSSQVPVETEQARRDKSTAFVLNLVKLTQRRKLTWSQLPEKKVANQSLEIEPSLGIFETEMSGFKLQLFSYVRPMNQVERSLVGLLSSVALASPIRAYPDISRKKLSTRIDFVGRTGIVVESLYGLPSLKNLQIAINKQVNGLDHSGSVLDDLSRVTEDLLKQADLSPEGEETD